MESKSLKSHRELGKSPVGSISLKPEIIAALPSDSLT